MDNTSSFYLPFLKKEQLTDDTYSFYFKRTGEERDFVAGQYVEIKLEIENPDDRGDSRVFTVCSSPSDKDYFMFTTRVIQSSFKKSLNALVPGQKVRFDGPWDDLNFDESDGLNKIFLAGGIGITPFHSIVQYCLDNNLDLPMTLFVSWSTKEEMVFDEFFRQAQSSLHNFEYIPTLTHIKNEDNWTGEEGRIEKEKIVKYAKDVKNSKYYIAGPPAFSKAQKEMVQAFGVEEEKILAEEFEGY